MKLPFSVKCLAAAALALAVTAPTFAQQPVRIGYAIARTGPWAAGAQVSQEPNYIMWAEQLNAAGGLNVKGVKRKIELIGVDDRSDIETVRAHLREADGQRQGRPHPAALGHRCELRDDAARPTVRLPDARADRDRRGSCSR